ncbi:MAG: nitrilase [Clostridia bacterium]|jgi:predicted amidohydrolase|nr:nitrilase [Clostridia bacterium]
MQNTRIALVQMEALINGREQNLAKLKKYIEIAAVNKAHIICFPETSIHGYSKNLYEKSAEPLNGVSRILGEWANKYSICILAGLAEKAHNKKPYITHLVVQPDTETGIYRKTHLGKSEKPYFSEGNSLPVFKTPTATIGIQICWDLHFPEISTIMSLKGAEIIFAPHASPTIVGDRKSIWLKYLTARAYDNAVFLAACNLIGENGDGQSFCGGALVIDPKGKLIAYDFSSKEGILFADLDPELINRIRKKDTKSMRDSFYLQSRRPELYKELLHQLSAEKE